MEVNLIAALNEDSEIMSQAILFSNDTAGLFVNYTASSINLDDKLDLNGCYEDVIRVSDSFHLYGSNASFIFGAYNSRWINIIDFQIEEGPRKYLELSFNHFDEQRDITSHVRKRYTFDTDSIFIEVLQRNEISGPKYLFGD